MFHQTPKLFLTKALLDNQPTMEITLILPQTHSEIDSHTPMLELVNGGKLASKENIGLTELESSIEETAAVTDSQEPKSSLMMSFADK